MSLWIPAELITASKLNSLAIINKSTRAALSAEDATLFTSGIPAAVSETGYEALYVFVAGSTESVDGENVLTATGGGRWKKIGGGGGASDVSLVSTLLDLPETVSNIETDLETKLPVYNFDADPANNPRSLLGRAQLLGGNINATTYFHQYIQTNDFWNDQLERLDEIDILLVKRPNEINPETFEFYFRILGNDWIQVSVYNKTGSQQVLFPFECQFYVIKERDYGNI